MKLLFRNQAYRLLTLSRFFNAFGASIFNLVFIVYASTLPQASFAVAMANIVMIIPTLFTVFVGIRADYTRAKVKWMVYSGLFQAVLFFLAALVVQQASLFAFSSLCLINVISDVISDFAGGLRMPLIKEKVAEDDLMEAYSFSQFITYISAIGGQAQVSDIELRKWIDELFPIILEIIQDSSSLPKREVGLWALGNLVDSTGYVVEPYWKYTNLLDVLLNFLKTEQSPAIRREAIRVLGLLGAIDPYKLKVNLGMIDQSGDSIIFVSDSSQDMQGKLIF